MFRKNLARLRIGFPILTTSAVLAVLAPMVPRPSAAEEAAGPDAAPALAILEQNCGNSGCHGGSNPYRFDVHNPATLLEAKVVQPGNAAGSEMIRRLEAGVMPLGGYNGQPGVKLPDQD